RTNQSSRVTRRGSLRSIAMLRRLGGSLVILLGLLLSSRVHAQGVAVTGRAYDASSDQGIPQLIVKLVPDTPQKDVPEHVTSTNEDGQFVLNGVAKGVYWLEVLQGVKVISRERIEVSGDIRKDVKLHRK